MAKAHPIELRERVVRHVEAGHTHRAAAAHFRVSVKFVNDMVKLKRETGSLVAKPLGNFRGHGKLEPYKDWISARVEAKGDITLEELRHELMEQFGVEVHHWSIGRLLHRLGLSHKKRRSTPKNSSGPTSAKNAISG